MLDSRPEPSGLLYGYIPEPEVSRERGVTQRTLRAERARGNGPPFLRLGKKIYYPRDAFRAWLKCRETRPVRSGKGAG